MIGDTRRPGRWQRAAAAADRGIADLELDRWDLIVACGVALLFAGLWIWLHLGAALTVTGVLLLGLGVAGARNAAAIDAPQTPTGRG